jgi:hypothetical protein
MNIHLAYIIRLFLHHMKIAVENPRDKLILQLHLYYSLLPKIYWCVHSLKLACVCRNVQEEIRIFFSLYTVCANVGLNSGSIIIYYLDFPLRLNSIICFFGLSLKLRYIRCFSDRASQYNFVSFTNVMHSSLFYNNILH